MRKHLPSHQETCDQTLRATEAMRAERLPVDFRAYTKNLGNALPIAVEFTRRNHGVNAFLKVALTYENARFIPDIFSFETCPETIATIREKIRPSYPLPEGHYLSCVIIQCERVQAWLPVVTTPAPDTLTLNLCDVVNAFMQ